MSGDQTSGLLGSGREPIQSWTMCAGCAYLKSQLEDALWRLKEMEAKMASVESRVRHVENNEGTPICSVAAPPPLLEECITVVQRHDQGLQTSMTIKEELKLDIMTYMYQNKGRPNMAKVLVEKLLITEERMTRNVNGARGKPNLDPVRMEAIKEAIS